MWYKKSSSNIALSSQACYNILGEGVNDNSIQR